MAVVSVGPAGRLPDAMSIFTKILRAGEGKKVRALASIVPDINSLEPELEALSDEQAAAGFLSVLRALAAGASASRQ